MPSDRPVGAADLDDPAPAVVSASDAFEAAGGKTAGIYALQATLRFDNLQAVAYDPQNESLTMLGERRSPSVLRSIPYLDHLGTAIDADHPTFTLPWTAASTRRADALLRDARNVNSVLWDRIVNNAQRQLFNSRGRLSKEGLRILKALNFPADGYEDSLTNKYDVMARTFEVCGGEQQATVVGSYARSLRDPDELKGAIRELAMAGALDPSTTEPDSAELWETFLKRFAGVFDADEQKPVNVFRRVRSRGEHIVIARNAAVDSILAAIEPQWVKAFSSSLELRAASHPHIYLPPDLVHSLAEIEIRVIPTWNRIEPTSRMAEVMFEADLLLKWVISDPTLLGSNLTGHLTEYEWSQRQGRSETKTATNNVRFWISPDQVQLVESDNGSVLEFRKFTMRVNTDDPASRPYAAHLTAIYEKLADEFSTLHELRECAKIVAVAQWLKRKAPAFRLPQEGRIRWKPPPSVPGFISIDAVVNVTRSDTTSETRIVGKWTGQAVLEGGVSLALEQATRANGSVLFDGARGPAENLGIVAVLPPGAAGVVRLDDVRQTVVPQIYDNQTLKNVLRQHTIPPPPMPPGATGKAALGSRKLEYVSVLRARLGDKANAAGVQDDLQTAVRLAKKLQFNDEMLNGLQAGRIKSLEAFRQAEAQAKADREQFLIDMFDTLTGGLSCWLGNQKPFELRTFMAEYLEVKDRSARHWLLLTNKYAPQVKTLLSDFDTARKSIGSEDTLDRNLATLGRGVDLASEINKAAKLLEETPLNKRIPGYTSLAIDTLKAARTIQELKDNLRDVDSLAEQAGNEAQFVGRLQKSREVYLKELQQTLKRLEQTAK